MVVVPPPVREALAEHARRELPNESCGLLVLRATARNRATIAEFPGVFAARFTGSSRHWLRSLTDPTVAMPDGDGLVWSSVRGDRLVAVSLRREAIP